MVKHVRASRRRSSAHALAIASIRQRLEECQVQAICPVCRGPTRQCVALVPCGHAFCQECVAQWLKTGSGKCPCCREQLNERTKWLRLRVMDDIMGSLSSALAATALAKCEEKPNEEQVNPVTPSVRPKRRCRSCDKACKRSCCHVCKYRLDICGACAEEEGVQRCEECQGFFCGEWCGARPCCFCSKAHVCSSCWKSPLRRCPRPEC